MTWGAAGQLNDPGGQVVETMNNIVDHPIPPLEEYSKYLIATYGAENARAMVRGQGIAITEIMKTRDGDLSLSQAGHITCPVLLITGEHDFFAPAENVAQLAARLPNAQAITVEGAGHDVHNARPEWFVQTVVNWLQAERSHSPAQTASARA